MLKHIPLRTVLYLLAGWAALAGINYGLQYAGLYVGIPTWFIYVVEGSTINWEGIPYLLIFAAVLFISVKKAPRLTVFQVWLVGLALIVLGNLGQGSWDQAFLEPLRGGEIQYYHDAVKIDSWRAWLASFNAGQGSLLAHTKTHPPFAVLIQYALLVISGYRLAWVALGFVFISSLSIPVIHRVFGVLQCSRENRNLLALLFAVIPAVNIYSAVSLEGVVMTGAAVFLLGLVVVEASPEVSLKGVSLLALGLVFVNLLTFGGVFLIAVAGLLAVREAWFKKSLNLALSLTLSLVGMIGVIASFYFGFGYNHFQGFLTASALENPFGFYGSVRPYKYLATRIENICENAIFLSLGFLAMLFHPGRLGIARQEWKDSVAGIMPAAVITLLAMFMSGAFRTGETARAALFFYPFIMPVLYKADSGLIRDLVILAALQTIIMQFSGNFFW